MKSGLFIPTIDRVVNAAKSFSKNLKKFDHDIPLIIVDLSEGKITKTNKKGLKKINHEIYYFDEPAIKKFLEEVGPESKILGQRGYGNQMNLGYLIASSLGLKVLHRRNSDECADNLIDKNRWGEQLDVCGIHEQLINKKLDHIEKVLSDLKNIDFKFKKGTKPRDVPMAAITGQVTGEPGMHFRTFQQYPQGFFAFFPNWRGNRAKLMRRISGEPVLINNTRFYAGIINNLTAGNMCLSDKVFKKIPAAPAGGVPGTDDENTGRMMVINQMPILLVYTPVGHPPSPSNPYVSCIKLAKSQDFMRACDYLLRIDVCNPIEEPEKSLELMKNQEFKSFHFKRSDVLKIIGDRISKAPLGKLQSAGKHIFENASRIPLKNDIHLQNFFNLVRNWHMLMKAAKQIDVSDHTIF